jgi:serine/threonine-protein kinase
MKTTPDRCEPDRLRLLAEDRLPSEELARLESHLEGCARCRDTLDRLVESDRWLAVARVRAEAEPSLATAAEAGPHSALGFLAPSDWPDSLGRLGHYEVKGVLGRGGMGVVLKAADPALNRNVAIKVMAVPLASCGASRQRFLREARAAAAVVHPHVVSVYAVEESAGVPYLVMEYVPGLSLQERIDRLGPSSPAEALRIGMQTAAGLAAAHAQGLVHRDIKPANILLENGVERVRLTDFGLARAAADAGLTQSGVVTGTPHYMSPEQARGEAADHRADLFSLGSTLYAACAGHPPFRAETPLAVLRRVCEDDPRPLREVNPAVPAWLEAIVARLMAKDPAARFQSAAEMADLLGRCLAHVQQPLVSPLPAELQRQETPPARARRRGLYAAAAVLALGLAAGALVWSAPRLTRVFTPAPNTGEVPVVEAQRPAPSRPQGAAADKIIQGMIDEAHAGARAVDADLHRQRNAPDRDPISAQGSALLRQAEALEQEIVSGRTKSDPNTSSPRPK